MCLIFNYSSLQWDCIKWLWPLSSLSKVEIVQKPSSGRFRRRTNFLFCPGGFKVCFGATCDVGEALPPKPCYELLWVYTPWCKFLLIITLGEVSSQMCGIGIQIKSRGFEKTGQHGFWWWIRVWKDEAKLSIISASFHGYQPAGVPKSIFFSWRPLDYNIYGNSH